MYYATDARKKLSSLTTAAAATTFDEAAEGDGAVGDASEASAEPKGPFLYDVHEMSEFFNSFTPSSLYPHRRSYVTTVTVTLLPGPEGVTVGGNICTRVN